MGAQVENVLIWVLLLWPPFACLFIVFVLFSLFACVLCALVVFKQPSWENH